MSALGQKRTISQRKRQVRVTFNSVHEVAHLIPTVFAKLGSLVFGEDKQLH